MIYLIEKFKKEYLGRSIVTVLGIVIILVTLSITGFLFYKGLGTFVTYNHSVWEFLFSSEWKPADNFDGGGKVGAAIFIVGSLLISFLALLIATPFSIASAVFMTEISPKLGKKLLQPAIGIFVGIPSVVYGWVGLTVLVPAIAHVFNLPYGFSVLAGGIVLALMIFPTITSVSVDAIENVDNGYKEASYALGTTRWQYIYKVMLPSATSGILTGVILGLARAFGEALAVAMVIGKMLTFPDNILSATNNMTAEIASDMGNSAQGGEFNDALWSMALLLLIISFIFILIMRIIAKKGEEVK
ncbi:phosphate ABC transporter permease subunit PstC [Acetobacterium paludosum]|uniref:phosphate ABC transporter permease subunit PstC n=1 Tax=Acetobacterium paludosum TaxID=52693 RepID=UPI00164C964F|nr:phosphate ABC transporter permease subunit PstC [Acetobacterium paludosum]